MEGGGGKQTLSEFGARKSKNGTNRDIIWTTPRNFILSNIYVLINFFFNFYVINDARV